MTKQKQATPLAAEIITAMYNAEAVAADKAASATHAANTYTIARSLLAQGCSPGAAPILDAIVMWTHDNARRAALAVMDAKICGLDAEIIAIAEQEAASALNNFLVMRDQQAEKTLTPATAARLARLAYHAAINAETTIAPF